MSRVEEAACTSDSGTVQLRSSARRRLSWQDLCYARVGSLRRWFWPRRRTWPGRGRGWLWWWEFFTSYQQIGILTPCIEVVA